MEDPAEEIATVARLVTGARNPKGQNAAVLKYYTPDMAFRHPLCAVPPAPNSRDALLGILDYYRILSDVHMRIDSVEYVEKKHTAYVEATQTFHIRWSPLKPAPARLLIRFKLRPTPAPTATDPSRTIWHVCEQEDFYHPDELAALFVPPLVPLIRWGLWVATLACRVNARVLKVLGC